MLSVPPCWHQLIGPALLINSSIRDQLETTVRRLVMEVWTEKTSIVESVVWWYVFNPEVWRLFELLCELAKDTPNKLITLRGYRLTRRLWFGESSQQLVTGAVVGYARPEYEVNVRRSGSVGGRPHPKEESWSHRDCCGDVVGERL